MPDLNKYAEWIVANPDKKGTEQYDTIATAYKDLRAQLIPPAPPQPEVGIGEAFGRGFERGKGRLGSTITDVIPALVGSAVGAEDYAQRQLQEAAEKQAALPAPVFESFRDIEGVGDFTKFVSETIGEQIPNLGVTLATALTGGAAAPALVGATRAAGQLAGAGFGSYALNAPEIFQNIYQETGETAAGTALLFGSAAAALDSILPAALAKNLSGPMKVGITEKILEKSGMTPGVLRAGTAGLAKGFGTEGLTEGAQEGISIAAERFIDENPDLFGSDEWNRIMEASVRGAVAGGGFGTVGGGVEGARGKAAERRKLRDLEEAEKLRKQTEERADILGGQLELPGVEGLTVEETQAVVDKKVEGTEEPLLGRIARKRAEDKVEQERRAGRIISPKVASLAPVVSADYALEVVRRTNPEAVPKEGTVKGLTEEQRKIVEAVQVEEGQKILYEDAAAEAQRQGVAFDITKPVNALTPAEIEILDDAYTSRRGRFSGAQTKLFKGKTGELAPSVERQAKAFDREQKALDKAAQKERVAQEKQDATRRKELLEAEQLDLPIPPVVPETEVSEAVTEEGQGDIFAGMPEGEQTRAPAVGRALNDFLKEQNLPVNAATKKAFAGLDLAIPEQRTQAINNLKEVAEKSGSTVNIQKIDDAIARLGGDPSQTIETVAEVTPAEEAQIAELTDKPVKEPKKPKVKARPVTPPVAARPMTAESLLADQAVVSQEETVSREPVEQVDEDAVVDEDVTEIEQPRTRDVETDLEEETLEDRQMMKELGYDLKTPEYQGKALNEELADIARRGNFRQLLTRLTPNQPIEIKRVLRKISGLGLTTKLVVAPTETGTSGSYDPVTNTITLDPETGLNEHTFLHETVHAAISQILNDRNNPLTKQFFNFYSDIKLQLGDAYGGQDFQEFAAELVGNPEFQALLKQSKAPKSQSLWQSIMDAIARFFGFRKGETAYNKGLEFIDQILDVSQGVEPSLSDKLFMSTPTNAMGAISDATTKKSPLVGKKLDDVRNSLSRLYDSGGGGTLISRALSAFRIQDLVAMTKDKYPELSKKLQALNDAILRREGAKDALNKEASEKYKKNEKIQKKFPKAVEKLGLIAAAAHRGQFDLTGNVDPEFDVNVLNRAALNADNKPFTDVNQQKQQYNKLKREFDALPAEVRDMYTEMRQDFKDNYVKIKEFIKSLAQEGNQKRTIEDAFSVDQPVIGYFPALRFGDYFITYKNASGDLVTTSFDSPRERDKFREDNNLFGREVETFDKTENVRFNAASIPPNSFIAKVMEVVPDRNKDQVYEVLLDNLAQNAFDQRFRQFEGRLGESFDVVKVHADTFQKGQRKILSMEYLPQIQGAFDAIAADRATGFAAAIKDEVRRRDASGFVQNPNYSRATQIAASGAFNLYLLGNASSALINTSAILLLTYPKLAAKYGFNKANKVLLSAMNEALPSFRPKEQRQDGLLEYKWHSNPKYKTLFEGLVLKAQLEHTLAREIFEGSKVATPDYSSTKIKTMNLLSTPFSATEKYSRATTAIATYNLAKAAGKTDAVAVEEAVNEVMDVHTSGIAAEGPSLMQHPVGRVVFTFKSFIWKSATVTGMAMYDSVANQDKATRRMARRQVLGIYGMSAALGGINGLPFFGATATFFNILNALNPFDDDDEPFNFKDEARAFTNDLVYKGPLNYATNLELSNRIGLANGLLFREDPYMVEKNGYFLTAVSQALGPVGSYVASVEDSAGLLEEGKYIRFMEAISPSAARNIFKTARYMKEGVRTRDGLPLDQDLNTWSIATQALGFAPADVSNMYERRAVSLNFQAKVLKRKSTLLNRLYTAIENGDTALEVETLDEIYKLGDAFPGLIKPTTVKKSLRSQASYAAQLNDLQLKIDPALKERINEKFLSDFVDD